VAVSMSRLAIESPRPFAAPGGGALRRHIRRAWLHLRVWLRSLELDRALAAGSAPSSSPELALRAELLVAERSRAALAAAVTAAVDAASAPAGTASFTPIAAARVLEAAGPLVCLARELTTAEAPGVAGVALASLLVCDGAGSPLYEDRGGPSAREVALRARAALAGG
jgi:hypothetical protein